MCPSIDHKPKIENNVQRREDEEDVDKSIAGSQDQVSTPVRRTAELLFPSLAPDS